MDAETVKKLLGKNIKSYRRTLGLTQAELGSKIGIDQRQVAYIENGHCFPSLQTLLKFAEIFECELKNIFEFETEVKKDLKAELSQKVSTLDNKKSKVLYQLLDVVNANF